MSLPRDIWCFGAGLSAGALLYYLTARRKSNIDTRGLIYFDNNATTPIDPQVADAMLPFLEGGFGNPSSTHTLGKIAKSALTKARGQIADLLQCSPSEIVHVSGATESINYAITGSALTALAEGRGNHIITCATEHEAVLEACRYMETQGCTVTYLPVDASGQVAVNDVLEAVTCKTSLVTIMHANNETGTIQPISQIVAALRQKEKEKGWQRILFHCDCSQAVGKISVTTDSLGVDYLTIAGHKFYGPKGVGALYVRAGNPKLRKLVHGAGHESGQRAGTENTLLLVGLGHACEMAREMLPTSQQTMKHLRDSLQKQLLERLPPSVVRVNGHPEERLPNTLSVSFKGVKAPTLLARIQHRVACSAGSACHATDEGEAVHASYVLQAMAVPTDFAVGTLRLSVGRFSSQAEVDEAAAIVASAVQALLPPL